MKGWYIRLKLKSMAKKAMVMNKNRLHSPVSDEIMKKEIELLYAIAKLYDKYRFHKKFPFGAQSAIEAYRVAASLNDPNAQYIVGQRLLEQGKYWDSFKGTPFESAVHQRYASDVYREAFAYLDSAEATGHALAKRLKGLAFINAWGVEKNSDKGFALVVDSIDLEKSWDRATKIFEEIGLNKPEFFSSIMSIRQKKA